MLAEKHFPAVRFASAEIAALATTAELDLLWLDLVLNVIRCIEPVLEADIQQIRWNHSSMAVGYFDYYTTYTTGYLPCNRGIILDIWGESDLRYEREGEDFLYVRVKKLKDTDMWSKMLYKNKGLAEFEFKTTPEHLKVVEACLSDFSG